MYNTPELELLHLSDNLHEVIFQRSPLLSRAEIKQAYDILKQAYNLLERREKNDRREREPK